MLKTAIAKTIGLVRALAPLLLGAMLPVLSLLASADAEAQTEFTPPQITIHIKANIAREADNRPPVQRVEWTWERITTTYSPAQLSEASGRLCEHGIDFDNHLACRSMEDAPFPNFPGGEPDYRSRRPCLQMGGNITLEKQQEVCSNMDTTGTFCFVGAPEVFPCRGLYKSALRCNFFNRPARNPFVCERTCPRGQFACGSGCWSGDIDPLLNVFSVAPGHEGAIFWATTTLQVGAVRITSLTPGFPIGEVDQFSESGEKFFRTTAEVLSAPLSAGSKHAVTLRTEFSCANFEDGPVVGAEWSFTVTALASPLVATLYYESGAGSGGGGRVTVNGITALAFHSGDATLFQVGEDGEVLLASPRPGSGESRTLTVLAYSLEEFLGAMRLTVQAEFRHPFHPDLGEGHCKIPDDQAQVRRDEACPASGYCEALDKPMFDALKTQDGIKSDSDLCRALRKGADVNVLDNGVYPMAIAATLNRTDIGEVLTLSGATIHSNEAEYGDALNYAAYAGSEKFARWLIVTVGASVNAQSGSGNKYAPVHMLGLRNFGDARDSAEFARLLTLHNADLDAEVASGPKEGYRYASFLTDPRTSGEPDYGALSVLVSAGVNLTYGHRLREEDTHLYPLDRAAKHNLVNVARVMLTRGNGIVNAVNRDGTTPIFQARTLEMVNLLVAAGADVNLIAQTSPDPTTPLDAMLNDYYPDHSDEGLRQAIDRLKESGEAQCLATYSNHRPAAVVNLCPNEVSCKVPYVSHPDDRLLDSNCTLECPAGYGGVSWSCPVEADLILNPSDEVDLALWPSFQIVCQNQAQSELSCLPR